MTIIQMQCFRALMKYGSFSKAAESLFMSQPSVSKYIVSLENECGFRLYQKHGRRIELTNEGRVMLRECNRLLSYYDQVVEVRNQLRNQGPVNELSFSVVGIPDMANYGILEGIEQYRLNNPEISVSISEMGDRFCFNSLMNGEADIAFSTDYVIDVTQFDYQKYCSERLCAVVSTASNAFEKGSIKLYELKGYELVAALPKSNIYYILENACAEAGFEPNVVFQTSKEVTALDYIQLHNNAVYIAAAHLFINYNKDKFRVIEIQDSPEFNFVLAWKKEKNITDNMKSFLKFMNDQNANTFVNMFTKEGPYLS